MTRALTGRSHIPLLERSPEDRFAQVRGTTISAATYLGHVNALAASLPPERPVFNLLEDRYAFTVGFVAVLAAGGVNLLPPNAKPAMQEAIAEHYPGSFVLHDGAAVAPGLESMELHDLPAGIPGAVPERAAEDVAAIAFTSGSTGIPQPIAKSLGMFRGAIDVYTGPIVPSACELVATVPAQHMYGLELVSLQPLWTPVTLTACKPLFPGDVLKALRDIRAPRVLVTTPLHLRALLDSGLDFPAIERVLTATAPLDPMLARRAEEALSTRLIDVYGCSEAGCVATRRAARDTDWTPLPGFSLAPGAAGRTVVRAAHGDQPVTLADRIEILPDGRFRLTGRLGDLINVAGKRGSLGEITQRILEAPGVDDGIAFLPPGDADNLRPAALYSGDASPRAVRAHLRSTLDDVFVPRPLLRVERLPRTETSKLPREALLALYRQQLEES